MAGVAVSCVDRGNRISSCSGRVGGGSFSAVGQCESVAMHGKEGRGMHHFGLLCKLMCFPVLPALGRGEFTFPELAEKGVHVPLVVRVSVPRFDCGLGSKPLSIGWM